MGTGDKSFRIKIQQGLREAETLLGQKQYNLSMVKARQTLEYMVNFLGEQALVVDVDLMKSIDHLFEARFISQTSRDHYHKIRILGNRAVHERDENPHNASEACRLLSEEVVSLLNSQSRNSSASAKKQPSETEFSDIIGSPSRSRKARTGAARSAQRTTRKSAAANARLSSSRISRSRRRAQNSGFDFYSLLRPALIFLVIVILVLILVRLLPGKGSKDNSDAGTSAPFAGETMPDVEPADVPDETEPFNISRIYLHLTLRKYPMELYSPKRWRLVHLYQPLCSRRMALKFKKPSPDCATGGAPSSARKS